MKAQPPKAREQREQDRHGQDQKDDGEQHQHLAASGPLSAPAGRRRGRRLPARAGRRPAASPARARPRTRRRSGARPRRRCDRRSRPARPRRGAPARTSARTPAEVAGPSSPRSAGDPAQRGRRHPRRPLPRAPAARPQRAAPRSSAPRAVDARRLSARSQPTRRAPAASSRQRDARAPAVPRTGSRRPAAKHDRDRDGRPHDLPGPEVPTCHPGCPAVRRTDPPRRDRGRAARARSATSPPDPPGRSTPPRPAPAGQPGGPGLGGRRARAGPQVAAATRSRTAHPGAATATGERTTRTRAPPLETPATPPAHRWSPQHPRLGREPSDPDHRPVREPHAAHPGEHEAPAACRTRRRLRAAASMRQHQPRRGNGDPRAVDRPGLPASSSPRVRCPRAGTRQRPQTVPRSLPPTSRATRRDSTTRSPTGSASSRLSRSRPSAKRPEARWSARRKPRTPGAARGHRVPELDKRLRQRQPGPHRRTPGRRRRRATAAPSEPRRRGPHRTTRRDAGASAAEGDRHGQRPAHAQTTRKRHHAGPGTPTGSTAARPVSRPRQQRR